MVVAGIGVLMQFTQKRKGYNAKAQKPMMKTVRFSD
jgi:hypothetical protein